MKYRVIRILLVCAIVSLLGTVGPAYAKNKNPFIQNITGFVQVNGKTAELNQEVQNGDRLVTGPQSQCDIVFNKKNILRIFEKSDTILNLDQKERSVEILTGSLASVARKLSGWFRFKKRMRYKIKTPTAIAGVRGTAFFVKVENPDTSYICLCNGKMEIAGNGAVFKAYEAKHHLATRITKKKDLIAVEAAEMSHHMDNDMESVAKAIDETIDWNRIE